MAAMTLTSKGRVTVPKEVRDFLGIGPGSKVMFEVTPMGDVMLLPLNAWSTLQKSVSSMRRSGTVKMSTDEIMRLTCGQS